MVEQNKLGKNFEGGDFKQGFPGPRVVSRTLPIGRPDPVLMEAAIEKGSRVISAERDSRIRGTGTRGLDGIRRSRKIIS